MFGADDAEPAGPKRITEVHRPFASFGEGVLAAMMLFAVYALYIMFVVDLARAALARRKR